MAGTATLTVRIDAKTKKRLEALAKDTRRSKSFLAAEAVARYVELEEWQIAHIKAGIADADAGRTIRHEKVKEWIDCLDKHPSPKCK
jgi:RHH-type rel operon transcriptional repressor/antitoxin RelB